MLFRAHTLIIKRIFRSTIIAKINTKDVKLEKLRFWLFNHRCLIFECISSPVPSPCFLSRAHLVRYTSSTTHLDITLIPPIFKHFLKPPSHPTRHLSQPLTCATKSAGSICELVSLFFSKSTTPNTILGLAPSLTGIFPNTFLQPVNGSKNSILN